MSHCIHGCLKGLHAALPERDSITYPILAAASLTTLSLLHFTRLAILRSSKPAPTIPGPSSTVLPLLSPADRSALPYPPDILPGGRDVASPYGNVRVYEWGPEDGHKVLLVHGITTPCLALGAVAHGLVDNGCRVMLFDLFGRGYSDNPTSLPHDARLYTSQILLALTSSPLAWTTSPGFSLLGYSLGGGIATAFASYFPEMVRSLLLLAPAGLIRPHHMGSRASILYCTGIVPESWLEWMANRRLLAGPMYAKENKASETVAGAEVPTEGEPNVDFAPLSRSHPKVTVMQAVQWQLRNHRGFVPAFLSSIRNAPLTGQEDNWRRLRDAGSGKLLLIVGTDDPIVLAKEVKQDAEALIGGERISFHEIDAAHDFPVTDSAEVVDTILKFWESESHL